MPNSILLKVTKIEQVMLITFGVIEKNEGGGMDSTNPPPPQIMEGLRCNLISMRNHTSQNLSYLPPNSLPNSGRKENSSRGGIPHLLSPKSKSKL